MLLNTLQEIKKLSPDYTLFSLHWGNEYLFYPSPSQVALAHELIDMGVNVIIGHHPHVVQPIEKYKGGIIMYSLGNFLFDMFWSEPVRNGMQVDLVFQDDKSIDYHVKPFRIRKNFTQDYTTVNWVLSRLFKSGKIMENLQSGPPETYQKIYRRECRKRRLQARLQMKLYLLIHLFSLSPLSRQLLIKNLKNKSGLLWKKL
jgi:poly-gamma-glutamate synthesis protein (capsule biosynthesis protein)